MHAKSLPLAAAAVLLLAGCVTTPEKTAATSGETVVQTDAPLESPTHVGSHIRSSNKSRKSSAEATQKMSGDEFRQQQEASRTDPTADQIMQARTEGR